MIYLIVFLVTYKLCSMNKQPLPLGRRQQSNLIPSQLIFKNNPKPINDKIQKHLVLSMISNTLNDGVKESEQFPLSDSSVHAVYNDTVPGVVNVVEEIPTSATGRFANVYWRSVPIEHLRMHPHFVHLPYPTDVILNVDTIISFSDCGIFRQDSLQWDLLHVGRLTTSRLACCLGFYEYNSSQMLHIPQSLRGHNKAIEAWQLVRQKPLSWTEFQSLSSRPQKSSVDKPSFSPSTSLWKKEGPFPFAYCPESISSDPKRKRSNETRAFRNAMSARLAWGSAQESTAILAALNCLLMDHPGLVVEETGMCLFESLWEEETLKHCDNNNNNDNNKRIDMYHKTRTSVLEGSLPLLGASPDGKIRYTDGRIEVLEVKCVAPFVDIQGDGNDEGSGVMGIRDKTFNDPIAVWHVPQVQWEMFCAGPNCNSAVAVTLGIGGATLCRINRDDQYIEEMLHLLKQFFSTYVLTGKSNRLKPPPINFFNKKTKGYEAFLKKTINISKQAVIIKKLNGNQIQRKSSQESLFF